MPAFSLVRQLPRWMCPIWAGSEIRCQAFGIGAPHCSDCNGSGAFPATGSAGRSRTATDAVRSAVGASRECAGCMGAD